jgi:hypothetical protein
MDPILKKGNFEIPIPMGSKTTTFSQGEMGDPTNPTKDLKWCFCDMMGSVWICDDAGGEVFNRGM